MAHDYYQTRGGEGISFEQDAAMLEFHGHQVIRFTRDNREIREGGPITKLRLSAATIWSRETYADLRRLLRKERPSVVHFQNIFPLISPSAYYACHDMGVPVVQNLRNYRMMCANVLFRRDGKVCEDCLGKTPPWPAIAHACYRQSRAASAVVAAMLTVHRGLGTWRNEVDLFVALTEFGRRKFIEGGLSPEQVVVRPNYLYPDPGASQKRQGTPIFVGRLSEEKGVRLLLLAWSRMDSAPLKLIGEGPLHGELKSQVRVQGLRKVEILGRLNHESVIAALQTCRFVIIPSLWYEGFNRVLVEAFACGAPVVAPALGTFNEIVEDGRTGLLFAPDDVEDLHRKLTWAWSHPDKMAQIGRAARLEFEAKYTPERNFAILMSIYERAIAAYK